jgi:hypothetical protein
VRPSDAQCAKLQLVLADGASLQRTSFAFFDETGVLPAAHERFFAVGMLKCTEPAHIQRPIQAMRTREHLWDEMKWSLTTKNFLPVYQEALEAFFVCQDAHFSCFIADKTLYDPIARFGDHWTAYERLATQLLVGNIAPDENVVVLADEISTPAHVTFEENLRDLVDRRLDRRAIFGVCRMRSTGVDVFQVLDLLLGAVQYEYRLAAGEVGGNPKNARARLLRHIQTKFGIATFLTGPRTTRLNVAHYKQ